MSKRATTLTTMPKGSEKMLSGDRTVILIGSSVRAAAADAKRAGYRVIAIDRYGDRDLLSLCDRWIHYDSSQQWISQLPELPAGPVVPLGGFQWPAPLRDCPAEAGCFGSRLVAFPDPAALAKLDSLAWLGQLASSCNVGFPETQQPVSGKMQTVVRSTVPSSLETDQWLQKPVAHGGGVGIMATPEASIVPPDQYLQRRLRGASIGANFVSYRTAQRHGTHLLGLFRGITYRRNPAHRFLYGGSIGPVPLCAAVTSTIEALGRAIAERLPLVGLFNVDLILGAGGELALLEVNPRYSASMELIPITSPTPCPLIQWHLECYGCHQERSTSLGDVADFVEQRKQNASASFACKRIVYAQTTSQVVAFRPSNAPRRDEALDDQAQARVSHCDLPRDGSMVAAGDPLCSVLVSGARSLRGALRLAADRTLGGM